MARHTVLVDFKDGHNQFFAGELREFSTADARRFADLGWVLVDGVTHDPQTGRALTLDVHNARLGHKAEVT